MPITATISIRSAIAADHATLEGLKRQATLANERDRGSLQANPEMMRLSKAQIEAGKVAVAEIEGAIVGFAVYEPDGSTVQISGLFVDPEKWRRGIGRRLLDEGKKRALGLGALSLTVIGSVENEAFYNACGFRTIGPHQTKFRPALLLSCRL